MFPIHLVSKENQFLLVLKVPQVLVPMAINLPYKIFQVVKLELAKETVI